MKKLPYVREVSRHIGIVDFLARAESETEKSKSEVLNKVIRGKYKNIKEGKNLNLYMQNKDNRVRVALVKGDYKLDKMIQYE